MRKTGRMLDWGSGGNEYNTVHPGMDSLDADAGKPAGLARGLKHFEQVANIQNPLPVPNNFYHLIRSNHSLGYVQDDADDFEEMKRVLAPGGTILIKASSNYETEAEKQEYIRCVTETFEKSFSWPTYFLEIFWKDDKEEHDMRYVATIEHQTVE